MFANLEREIRVYQVEVLTGAYLFRARLEPFGELASFINDRRRTFISLHDVHIAPLDSQRRTTRVKRKEIIVNRGQILMVNLVESAESEDVQILAATRPTIFYLDQFAVEGQLHVNVDANDEDLLDEARDFYPVSEATIFPMITSASQPAQEVPLLFIRRAAVHAYQVRKP